MVVVFYINIQKIIFFVSCRWLFLVDEIREICIDS